MKKAISNNIVCLVSAAAAGAFFLFVCFYFKTFPFGREYNLFKIDMVYQYAPMLNNLYDLIKSGHGITYSWSAGLGYSFIGNFINYIASPFNLIVLLFDRQNIPDAISVIIMLKSMLAAGCFSYFLRKTYSRSDALNVSFSLLYAFSGWFVAYYWNIMWLDVLFCLPLAALGLQRIINDRKPLLYILTLAYSMLVNYYTAYMLCVFLCIYFVYYYISNTVIKNDFSNGLFKSNLFKSGVLFAVSSFVAVALAAAALLPIIIILKNSSAVTDTVSNGIEAYFNPLTFWARHFSGVECVSQNEGIYKYPNIWCGMLTVLLLPIYFFSKGFSKKERICDFCLTAILGLSLGVNVLCFVWCGFHFPNAFGDRFAFLYVFTALIVTFKAINNIAEIKPLKAVFSVALAVAFITVMYVLQISEVDKYTLIISIGFAVLWLVIFLFSKIKKLDKSLLKFIVLFFVCLELIFSQLENLDFNYYRNDYDQDAQKITKTCSMIKEKDSELFFRTESKDIRAFMLPMIADYSGVSDYSSVTSFNVSKNQCALGMSGNRENRYTYILQTPVYNSMFGLKYLFCQDDSLDGNPYFEHCFDNEGFSVYRNRYYLPLGYCVNNQLSELKTENYLNPFYEQNEMFSLMSGQKGLFDYCDPDSVITENLVLNTEKSEKASHTQCYSARLVDESETGFATFRFVLPKDGEYYFVCDYKTCEGGVNIDISGEEYDFKVPFSNIMFESKGITPINQRKKGDTVTFEIPVSKEKQGNPISVYVASFNKDSFIKGYERLSQNTLNLTEFENTHFKGSVTADEDCLLFTSIPYDKGWQITLDGNTVDEKDVTAIDSAYISIPLTKGVHTVEFDYYQPGLKVGAVISITTAAGLIVFLLIRKKRK